MKYKSFLFLPPYLYLFISFAPFLSLHLLFFPFPAMHMPHSRFWDDMASKDPSHSHYLATLRRLINWYQIELHYTCSLKKNPPMLHTCEERVWWHLADTLGFINVDYFLERNFSPPITLQKRQSVVQHRKFLATSARWHSTFFGM